MLCLGKSILAFELIEAHQHLNPVKGNFSTGLGFLLADRQLCAVADAKNQETVAALVQKWRQHASCTPRNRSVSSMLPSDDAEAGKAQSHCRLPFGSMRAVPVLDAVSAISGQIMCWW